MLRSRICPILPQEINATFSCIWRTANNRQAIENNAEDCIPPRDDLPATTLQCRLCYVTFLCTITAVVLLCICAIHAQSYSSGGAR